MARYLDTGTLPGAIEAYLTDAAGFRWQIVEKSVVFAEHDALEGPPQDRPTVATLDCKVVLDTGGPTVGIVLTDVSDGRIYQVARSTIVDN